MMKRHGTQQGSIIIYAMLTMSAMLAIALTLSGLFIGKLRSATNARASTIAIYAADSAAEKCLYEARHLEDQAPIVFANGATYAIASISASVPAGLDKTDLCASLGDASFQFRATGKYQGVSRTLEITQ